MFNLGHKNIIQPKLTIGQPNDRYEQEADQVADQVMSMPKTEIPGIQRKCANCEEEELQMKPLEATITPIIQKQEEEEEEMLQMKGSNNETRSISGLESSLQQSKGGGHYMDASTQQQMNRGIGADFSNVKIHTDNNAIQMNRQLNAKAFTNGPDVYFNQDKYNPHSSAGKHLLAHELTHVVQQGNSFPGIPSIQKQNNTRAVTPGVNGSRLLVSPTTGVPIQNGVLHWRYEFLGTTGGGTGTTADPITRGHDVRILVRFVATNQNACETYTFMQIVNNTIGGQPEHEHTHLMNIRNAQSGYAVDMLSGNNDPFYTAERDSAGTDWEGDIQSSTSNYLLAGRSRGNTATFEDTPMISPISIPTGQRSIRDFEVAVICVESGQTLGSLKWGYTKTSSAIISLNGATTNDVRSSGASQTFEGARQSFYSGFFQHSMQNFGRGSASLTAGHRRQLTSVIASRRVRMITLIGGNDNSGGPENNVQLSIRRANAVKMFLIRNGVPNNKIRTEGHGVSTRYQNTSRTQESRNRRVDIHIDYGETSVDTTYGTPSEGRLLRQQDPNITVSELVNLIDTLYRQRGTIARRDCNRMRNLLDAIRYWRTRDRTVPNVMSVYRTKIANIFRRCQSIVTLPSGRDAFRQVGPRGPLGRIKPPSNFRDRIIRDADRLK